MEPLYNADHEPMRVLAMVSEDTHLLKEVLNRRKTVDNPRFEITGIYCDKGNLVIPPDLTQNLDISRFTHDIFGFYKKRGLDDIHDLNLRAEFDTMLADYVNMLDVDIIAFMGYPHYVTPSGMMGKYGVNVHHGDLRCVDENGKRKYAGTKTGLKKMLLDQHPEIVSTASLTHPLLPNQGQILAISKSIDASYNPDLLAGIGEPDLELVREQLRSQADGDLLIHTLDLIARKKFLHRSGKIYYEGKEIRNGISIDEHLT